MTDHVKKCQDELILTKAEADKLKVNSEYPIDVKATLESAETAIEVWVIASLAQYTKYGNLKLEFNQVPMFQSFKF